MIFFIVYLVGVFVSIVLVISLDAVLNYDGDISQTDPGDALGFSLISLVWPLLVVAGLLFGIFYFSVKLVTKLIVWIMKETKNPKENVK